MPARRKEEQRLLVCRLYADEKRSSRYIAGMVGTSHVAVIKMLRRCGVQIRGTGRQVETVK